MAFTVHAVMPGVWHIVDCMGVCMTLLEGENAAMLVDTGYGIEDVADFMRHMTDLPLTVFLTHNHHDHAMGARCFPETYMLEADMAVSVIISDVDTRYHLGIHLPLYPRVWHSDCI